MSRRFGSRALSCGVIVTDGVHLLIGHATRSPRWDIPKGLANPGEPPDAAARRELLEETGLQPTEELVPLGCFPYLPTKDLSLFLCWMRSMPDPRTLVCRSTFAFKAEMLPELDRFDCPVWEQALVRLGKSLMAVLTPIAQTRGWLHPDSAGSGAPLSADV